MKKIMCPRCAKQHITENYFCEYCLEPIITARPQYVYAEWIF